MKEFWNNRYQATAYAYGKQPNDFFRVSLRRFKPSGKILLPAEGEGRNAVYAAQRGLEVHAFDISEAGKTKAERLAAEAGVSINYEVGDFFQLPLLQQTYDVIALIYAHFPPPILSDYHQKMVELLNPGGLLLLEGFSKGHLPLRQSNPRVGGPGQVEMLFSTEQIAADFAGLEVLQLEEKEIVLQEGDFHNGRGKVIRFVGRKR